MPYILYVIYLMKMPRLPQIVICILYDYEEWVIEGAGMSHKRRMDMEVVINRLRKGTSQEDDGILIQNLSNGILFQFRGVL